MKKNLRFSAAVLLIMLTVICFGCDNNNKNNELNYKKTYYQYYFNTDTERFEKVSNSYAFNADGSFVFTYANGKGELNGTYTRTGGNYIEMSYDVSNSSAIIRSIMEELGDNTDLTQKDILTLTSQIDFNDTLFAGKNTVFSSTNVQAYKYISSTLKKTESTAEVEGVYRVREFDYLLYVSNGDIYSQDENDPDENEFPIYRGSYKVVGDFIFLEFKNSKKEPALAKAVYYLGTVILPDDLTVDEDEQDETMLYLEHWSGMTVRCWTNSVYSTEDIG